MGWGAMSCVCILWQGGVSCPVSVNYAEVGCHVLCLYTVLGWGVMSCVCILCWSEVSSPVSAYYAEMGVVMPCVCILCWGGVSCPVSLYYAGVGCHVLCLYTVTGSFCVCDGEWCHDLCLLHDIPAWQHNKLSKYHVWYRHRRDMPSDVLALSKRYWNLKTCVIQFAITHF